MLADINGLLYCDRGFRFSDKRVEILLQQDRDDFREIADNPEFNTFHFHQYVKSDVVKYRVGVQDQKSSFRDG